MNADLSGAAYERTPSPGNYSPVIEGIKANAEAAVQELGHLTDIQFGYNRESVAWLESYLERINEAGAFNGAGRDKLISVFGSFLGECLIHCCGGSWKKRGGAWGIAFDDENIALPFAAIATQVEHGSICGIRSFFEMAPITFIGSIQPKPQPQEEPQTAKRRWAFWRKAS